MEQQSMTIKGKLNSKLKEYWRVLRLTKKPNMDEFKTIVKVSGLGMIIIGMIGFAITLVVQLLF